MTHFRIPGILMLVCACACMAAAAHADKDEELKYKVKLHGAKDNAVKKAIKESTATCKLRKQPPSTIGQLHHRMEKDLATIEAILESRGYYDGTVAMALDGDREPARASFRVEQGTQYRFRSVDLQFAGEPDADLGKIKSRLRKRQRVVAAAVFEEEQRILDEMKRRGHPFPRLVKRTVVVDRENRVVDLVLVFDPGVLAYFGDVQVEGLETLPEKFIRRQLTWKPGDKFDAKQVSDFENKLLDTGVFGSARVEPQAPPSDTNAIPVLVRVSERDQRTVRLGVNYSDIGFGTKAYWEHRNIFGGGERLQTSLEWNPIKLGGSGTLTRSGFLDANQSLLLDVTASIDTPDAYDAKKITGTAMVLRDLTKEIQGGIGVGYKHSTIEQLSDTDRYNYVFFPLQGIYDSRNEALNPVRGMQLFGRTSYFQDTLGTGSFLKTQLDGRQYSTLWERYRLSSALRLTLGSIDGASVDSIPADERFYAGGGGSIRGYEYQGVGPRVDGVPTGGDKLLEFSAELRLQPGRRLGYAAFIDGGTSYDGSIDDYDKSLSYGAGLGLRWFTTIGPLRADLAYPLNPDDDQVVRIQFYISLGQAF